MAGSAAAETAAYLESLQQRTPEKSAISDEMKEVAHV
jgi:hypothetical protein